MYGGCGRIFATKARLSGYRIGLKSKHVPLVVDEHTYIEIVRAWVHAGWINNLVSGSRRLNGCGLPKSLQRRDKARLHHQSIMVCPFRKNPRAKKRQIQRKKKTFAECEERKSKTVRIEEQKASWRSWRTCLPFHWQKDGVKSPKWNLSNTGTYRVNQGDRSSPWTY